MNTNKYTALSSLENSIKTASDLENNRYKNQAALRNSHDDDADFFNDIGNAVIGPSGRPRGIGANLAYGTFKGLAHGAKSRSTSEKKDNYDKHANVANYLQNLQGEVVKQNQWYEQEERRMETVKPFAVGGLEVAYSGMPYETGNDRMRNIVEQAKIADPRIKGDYIGYVPNSPIINMRDKDGNIIAFSLSNLVGEDVVKRVQDNYIEQQKLAKDVYFKQSEHDLKKYEKGIRGGQYDNQGDSFGSDNKFEYNGHDYDVVPLRGLQKSEISDYGKIVNKAISQIPTNENSIKAIHKMREVFEKYPNIGESWINMLNNGDDEETWGKWISKKINSREERAAMEILKKESSDLNLSTVLSVPGKSATDLLKRAIQSSSPTGTMTKEAFDTVANEWEERAINNIDMARAQAQARSQGRMIVSKSRNLPTQSTESEWGNMWEEVK